MKTAIKISSLLIMCLLLCSGSVFSYKFRGIKVDKVEITIPAQLYASYKFSGKELNAIRRAVNGDEVLVDEIDEYHVEQNWPEPLNDFYWRIEHGPAISGFAAYRICEISEGKCLLVVPMEKNRDVKEVTLNHDIYFVMKTGAVK